MNQRVCGPWAWMREGNDAVLVTRNDADQGNYDNPIAEIHGNSPDETERIAKMMATAPELLGLCEDVVVTAERYGWQVDSPGVSKRNDLIERLFKVFDKAGGKLPSGFIPKRLLDWIIKRK